MKVVIDTNIFVSSFFGGNPRKIIDLWRTERITLCLSHSILDEYIDVLNRVGMRDESELDELLSLFSKGFNLLFTSKTPKIQIVKNDPDDDKFIPRHFENPGLEPGDEARLGDSAQNPRTLARVSFIECALALKADAVITGDREVLAVKECMGIRMLTPHQFLEKYREYR
jgi:putative PIN family toxin of toxin-antitoxin system